MSIWTRGLAALGLAFTLLSARAADLPGPVVITAWLAPRLAEVQVIEVRSDAASFNRAPVVETDKKSGQKVVVEVGGHLPGARTLDFKHVRAERQVGERKLKYLIPERADFQARMRAAGVLADRPIVLVPMGQDIADIDEALRLYWTFKVYGEDRVAVLDGGTAAWLAEGREIQTGLAPALAGTWSATAERTQWLAGTDDVAAATRAGVQLVDGRALPQFHGLTKRDYVAGYGHIEGARVLAPELLTRAANGALYFLPVRTYEAVLKASGIEPGAPAIAYCNSGHLAAGPWFVMSEIVGNKSTRLYDGSLYLWTLDKRPLVSVQ